MDKLLIKDLKVSCRIGAYDWEREKAQPVWLDLELSINASEPAKEDDLEKAIDYARLIEQAKTLIEKKHYQLMETAAEQVALLILKEFQVASVTVRLRKCALPGIAYAQVELTRS